MIVSLAKANNAILFNHKYSISFISLLSRINQVKNFIIRSIILLITLSYSNSVFSQSTAVSNSKDEVFEEADEIAVPPGGLTAFCNYIQNSLVYPISARSSSKEGKVYVGFVVNALGYIEPNSVRTVTGIDSVCDIEAEHVIRNYKGKWTPAKIKGRAIRQGLCLPINFILTDEDPALLPIPNTLETIVKANSAKTSGGEWIVYKDKDMNLRAGSINAGDSVRIIGWAPWLYSIQSKTVNGFVPYRALAVTIEMREIDDLIKKESAIIEDKLQQDRIRREQESIKFNKDSLVFLDLNVSKKNVREGECVSLSLAVYVNDKNRKPYQFYDLAQQIRSNFYPQISNLGLNISDDIVNIVGARSQIENEYYTFYKMYSGAFCPTRTVTFNPVELKLLHHGNGEKPETGELVSFFSKPVTISVSPLPDSVNVLVPNLYSLVGNYKVSESIQSQTVKVGTPLKYSITIKGNGPTLSLPAPWWSDKNLFVELIDIQQKDTTINDSFLSSRTFTYQLIFNKAGDYNFSNNSIFPFFDPEASIVKVLKGGPKITVTLSSEKNNTLPSPKSNFIVFDISQSMWIEDYKPSRLKATLNGLTDFFSNNTACNIGLILFGGNARPYSLSKNGICYSPDMISNINSRMVKNGTAIGDALWLAIESANHSTGLKNIVIIGDGDNTAGLMSITSSVFFAKRMNIKINTIGIGTRGLVPFGKDGKGNPHMIDDTFSDEDFKRIATDTGGKYYWAKDEKSISQILTEIFK